MKLLLIAISNLEWSALVCEFLQENGFQVLTASSLEESVELVKSRHLDGIVMTADWAVVETGGGNETLMGLAKDKIPTVTIIEKNSYDILDVVYPSAMHQFVTTPFSGDGLLGRFERAMQNKKK
jgi:DNA-binding response OmpR family regulator